ncbi:hypothetical protein [Jannaschia seosinensis]|nr:hypothetical protein [Jannaschia seosinensis]
MNNFHPDALSDPSDAMAALEREHEELQALLRDEIEALRTEGGIAALRIEEERHLKELAHASQRLKASDATRGLDAALLCRRLRLGVEGRPRGLPSLRAQAAALRKSPLFDAESYRAALCVALPRRLSAERHYVAAGAFEGLDPGPDFSTRTYYMLNPDVLEAGWPALAHYVLHGAAEGRQVRLGNDESGNG